MTMMMVDGIDAGEWGVIVVVGHGV